MAAGQQEVWLVTGANRGIGLEYVTQLLKRDDTHVIACARSPGKSQELQTLRNSHTERLQVVTLDLADEGSIKDATEHLKQAGWDQVSYLINNAGVLGDFAPVEEQDLDDFKHVLLTNVVGTFAVTKAFLPFLRKGSHKTIVNMSSDAGCLTQNASFIHNDEPTDAGLALSYRASKVALNMETTVLANALKKDGFIVVSLHPGFVHTDMGKQSGESMQNERPGYGPSVTPEDSVSGLLKIIKELKPEQSGEYRKYDGEKMPW